MSRLDKEREAEFQPKRKEYAKAKIQELGFLIDVETDTMLSFTFKEHPVVLYAYSGWHTGKSIKDGRGLQNLLNQLKQQ